MQCGEEPGFDLRQILELMSFVRPDVEGLLGEVASIGLTSGETETEPVKVASLYRLLDAANSNTVEGFFTARTGGDQKKLRSRGGFQVAFPL